MKNFWLFLLIISGLLTLPGCGSDGTTPVANAGPDQNVATAVLATCDGSASTSADGAALTYKWAFTSLPAGSNAVLSGASTVNPTFTPDVDGIYILALVVQNSSRSSAPDTVWVTASSGNSAPVANAGPDQNVTTSSVVTLDGSGSSDINGDPLTYSWSLFMAPAGSAATLSDATVVNPTFTADVDGSYVFSLIANDGTLDSAADTITVLAATANSAPVANAGPDQNVTTGALVTMDSSGSSDADSDPLTYAWSLTSTPVGSSATLSDPLVANPTFTADLDGTYVLSLIVNDGTVDSAADNVTVIATTANAAPTANAGPDQNLSTGSLVSLDGSGSSDTNGDPLTYSWTLTSIPVGSSAALSDPAIVNPTFTADVDGSYVLSLVVNDGTVDSTADTMTVVASTMNSAPVADAGPDQSVTTGSLVTLDSSGSSDADTDPLTYSWAFTSVPATSSASLSNPAAANPTFTADLDGSYILSLVVNDGTVDSAADTVTITAAAVSGAAGTLDTTFDGDGIAVISPAGGTGQDYGRDIVVDISGNVFITGSSQDGSGITRMFILKYTSGGTLDPSFGTGGIAIDDGAYGRGSGIALDSSGNVFITGNRDNGSGNPDSDDMAIWKYSSSGVLDPTFGTAGIVLHNNAAGGNRFDKGNDIAIDSLGNIYVAGHSSSSSATDMAIWKYSSSGVLDATFGTGGIVVSTGAAGGTGNDYGLAIALDTPGNIFVTGSSLGASNTMDMVIWKYTSSGVLDGSFGTGGIVIDQDAAGAAGIDYGTALILDSSGNIYVTGYSRNLSNNDDMVLWKYTSSGVLDGTFGTGGIIIEDGSAGGTSDDQGHGIALDKSGNIFVAGGSFNASGNYDMATWKYTNSGVPDATFGTGGIVAEDGAAGGLFSFETAYGIALDRVGNIYTTGAGFNLAGNLDVVTLKYK